MAKKTLYHNGIILTVDSEDFVAGAVLTEDGTIVAVGDKIPNNLLMEDEVLLQFYDIASSRI